MISFIKKFYSLLLNFYDALTAKKAEVSVGDIVGMRSSVENNQFLVATRLLDIKDYCERGKKTFDWQNTISRKAYGAKHREERGNNAFIKLIESYRKNGYDSNSYHIVDKELRLLDGNHRMGMNIYTGVDTVRVKILKRKSKNPEEIDWYLKAGLKTDFIEKVLEEYSRIQEKLTETGNTFCAFLPAEELVKDIGFLTDVRAVNKYSLQNTDISFKKDNEPSKTGFFVRFTLKKPDYFVNNDRICSRRAEEIEKILKSRTTDCVIISKNCLEGKKMFEKVKGSFIN